ncbi:uncharacterized membrane protein YhaH (DUF805 family) [Bradyrhizobium sp. RT3b]
MDDAVVVIENIVRHVEAGLTPMEAALQGSREIGFTIVSITLSLIAVFIPLFLMGGYVGELFQEFAVTVSVSLVLSLLISLTLTPMMCARLLKHDTGRHGWLYIQFERGFDGLLAVYARGLKVALRHRLITLTTLFLAIGLTGYFYVIIPKGFFPQQDTGMITAIAEAGQDISYPAMVDRMQALIGVVLKDPAVASTGAQIGAGGATATLNDGRMFIALKPLGQRDLSADQVIARLRTKLASVSGITLYMQSAQDITVGARLSKTQYQYTLTDADSNELTHWSAIFLEKLKAIPGIVDVTSDEQNAGPRLNVTVNRPVASSFGILPSSIDNTLDDAFGQRIVSTMFTPLNQYHVVMEVNPRFQTSPMALERIYLASSSGQEVPLSTLTNSGVAQSILPYVKENDHLMIAPHAEWFDLPIEAWIQETARKDDIELTVSSMPGIGAGMAIGSRTRTRTDRDRERHQGKIVEAVAEFVEDGERADERQRHGDGRNDGRPEIAKEDEDDHHDECHGRVEISGRPGAASWALTRIARASPRVLRSRCSRARSSCRSMLSGASARALPITAMASSRRRSLASWPASSWNAGRKGGRRAAVRRNCSTASVRRPDSPKAAPSRVSMPGSLVRRAALSKGRMASAARF